MFGLELAARRRRRRRPRQRAGEPLAHLGDHRARALVAGVDVLLLDVGVGQHRDRVLEVVERDQHVGEHQRHVGQPDRVGVRLAQRLDRAHAVVAEEADRAARERRQAGQRRLAVARDLGGGERVGIAAVGQRSSAARRAAGSR